MPDNIIEAFKSFGIEMEFTFPTQRRIGDELARRGVRGSITYDASAESQISRELRTGLPLYGDTGAFRMNSTMCGGEFVSRIWNNQDPRKTFEDINVITAILQKYGEPTESTTAGIHFHQSYPVQLEALKNVVLLFSHLEKFMFSLGGMGYKHRGAGSDAVYYRPITGVGPIVVPVPRGWAQCFSVDSLLKAQSIEEFFQRYGDATGTQRGVNYPVVRYHWLNLVNLVRGKRTLEVRVFNTTLDSLKIWAMLQLFLAAGKYAFAVTPQQLVKDGVSETQSVFEPQQESFESTLERIIPLFEITDKLVINTLVDLAGCSEDFQQKSKLVRSHLHDRHSVTVHWAGFKNIPEPPLNPEDICHPVYVDKYVSSGEVNPLTRFRSLDSMRENTVRRGSGIPPVVEYEYSTYSKKTSVEELEESTEDPRVRILSSFSTGVFQAATPPTQVENSEVELEDDYDDDYEDVEDW